MGASHWWLDAAITAVTVVLLFGCAVALLDFWHARRAARRRDAVFNERLKVWEEGDGE